MWIRYVASIFIVWNPGYERLPDFRATSKHQVCDGERREEQSSFFNVLIVGTLASFTKSPQKQDRIVAASNHTQSIKHGDGAMTICKTPETLLAEVTNIGEYLGNCGYNSKTITKIIEHCDQDRTSQTVDDGSKCLELPYLKGLSKKICRLEEKYQMKTIFLSFREHTLE